MLFRNRDFRWYYIGIVGVILVLSIIPLRDTFAGRSKAVAPAAMDPAASQDPPPGPQGAAPAKQSPAVPTATSTNATTPPAARPSSASPTPNPSPTPGPAAPNFLHTQGSKILDAQGNEVQLTGINWFGMETGNLAPHGIWSRRWQDMLDLVAEMGFNTVRLPYSNDIFKPDSKPNGIDFHQNPDLQGLGALELMDRVVEGAGERGLKVILDRHRPDQNGQSNLWYTDKVGEARWIEDWKDLARRYRGNDTVIGADLHNEPHGEATWGDGNPKTDWRLAAEKAGNAILSVNPDWLIFVEGIDTYKGDGYWWGGNLKGVVDAPVRLEVPNRLVYSAHDYGPGVYNQSWFIDKSFPGNLPGIWDAHWAFIQKQGIAPVLMGEFGGRSVGIDPEGVWQRALFSFLKERGIHYTYWSLNPNSGDTGGVLQDDWKTINQAKLSLLKTYQRPLLDKPKKP